MSCYVKCNHIALCPSVPENRRRKSSAAIQINRARKTPRQIVIFASGLPLASGTPETHGEQFALRYVPAVVQGATRSKRLSGSGGIELRPRSTHHPSTFCQSACSKGRPSPPQATPSWQHVLVKMPRFVGAMIPAMKLTILVLIALITLGNSVSMARSHKTHHKPRYGAVITGPQYLSPEAAAMRNAQRSWPNRPLCDDGGYRIRPCDLGGDRR